MSGAQAQPADSERRIVFSRALPDSGVNTYTANPDGNNEQLVPLPTTWRFLRTVILSIPYSTKIASQRNALILPRAGWAA